MSTIKKRMVFYIKVKLASPLSVSSGDDEWTDSDVLKNADEKPFVPGSSLAGAMRAYLGYDKTKNCFMGYSDEHANGKMSSLFISDLEFDGDTTLSVRDGVKLDDNKTAVDGSKYDIEIIEAGAKAYFYMELTIRAYDDENSMISEIKKIFHGLDSGEIRLGKKKTRGLGELKIEKIKSESYDKNNYTEYENAFNKNIWENKLDRKSEWVSDNENQMIHVKVPLKLAGGISIRQYAGIKGEPDFVHICSNGKPVIPGSSMAGAIRHRIDIILRDLYLKESRDGKYTENTIDRFKEKADEEERKESIEKAFGYVNGKDSVISNIIFSEAIIEDAKKLTSVRTAVSRFESSAKNGSLYKEETYVGGTTNIEITIRKNEKAKWILGLLLLAVKDLQNGLLSVGGQTAIGRGIFSENGPISIDGEQGKENDYIKEKWKYMKGACK